IPIKEVLRNYDRMKRMSENDIQEIKKGIQEMKEQGITEKEGVTFEEANKMLEQVLKKMNQLFGYLENYFKSEIKKIQEYLKKGMINWDSLWYIFTDNAEIYYDVQGSKIGGIIESTTYHDDDYFPAESYFQIQTIVAKF